MIDFTRGHPNASLLPSEETRGVLEKLYRQTGDANPHDVLLNALQYGNEEGNPEFLDELRAFLQRHTRDVDFGELGTITDEPSKGQEGTRTHFFVTNGVSHGLELLCATQTQPGDVVLVERPTYFLAGGILKSHGLIVRGLPMHESTGGVDVDKLVELVKNGTMEVPRIIYIIPTHQNPTSHTMKIEDRIKLASFACRHGVLVVADEVYNLLDWRNVDYDGPRPAGMASISAMLCDSENDGSPLGGCVSVSSFTKIFAPGLRLGWIEGSRQIVQSLCNYGYIQSQVGARQSVSVFVNERSMIYLSFTEIGWMCTVCGRDYANCVAEPCSR